MKTSVSLFLSDILPHKRKLYHKVVKNDIFGDLPPSKALPELKEAGLDGIEVCLAQFIETSEDDIKEVMTLSKKFDLPILSVHQMLRFVTSTKVSEIERLMQIAKAMGAPLVVLHMSSAKAQIFDQSYLDALHSLEKQYGISITFENMERYFGSLHSKHRWDGITFSELVNKTDFDITFDIVHLAHSGGDIIEFFEKNKKRITNIHLSDYKFNIFNSNLRPMRYKHMPLGAGDLPIVPFLDLLKKSKYKGLITMEIHGNLTQICDGARIINENTK